MLELLSTASFESLIHQSYWFVISLAVFGGLAFLSPAVRGQKWLRAEWKTDLAYWFIMPLFYGPLSKLFLAMAVLLVFAGEQETIKQFLSTGRAPYNEWHILLQMLVVRLIIDMIDYWTHRLFHTARFWKWHAIHHMPEVLDWLSSVRFHPVNSLFKMLTSGMVIALVGFNPMIFFYLVAFEMLYAGMVHANLNWTFGPFKYVFASPVFHRWHHTSPEHGGDKNFASVFSFIDVIFGTFYMPKGKRPEEAGFGVSDDIPKDSFIGQLAWPFKK